MSRRFSGFKRLDEAPVEGEPWWEENEDCVDLIERACVWTPFGIVLIDEIFDALGRPVESFALAYGFEGVVVAGGETGHWVEGPLASVEPVRVQ